MVALGPGAAGFAPGQTVAAARAGGGYADLTAVDAADALPLPPGLPVEQALAEPLACAVNTVRELAPAPADTIVLLGAGFMGLLLTQLLRPLAPSLLLATSRRPEARDLALSLGASEACDPAEVQARVHELTGGEGVDLVIEASGSEPLLAIAASLLRPEGTLGIVGYHQGQGRQVPLHEWNWKALAPGELPLPLPGADGGRGPPGAGPGSPGRARPAPAADPPLPPARPTKRLRHRRRPSAGVRQGRDRPLTWT